MYTDDEIREKQQSVAAPPTGHGLIDKQRLIDEFGYTVYTDGDEVLSNSISISPPQFRGKTIQ